MKNKLSTPFINGIVYSWSSIDILVSGAPLISAQSIDYSEECDIQPVYGRGNMVIGYGIGNYASEASISVLISDIIALQNGSPNKNLMEVEPFDIVVSYIPINGEGQVVTDKLKNCMFKNNMRSSAQGDTQLAIDLDIMVSHIEYGDIV